jgi:hypothetical protein
MDLKQELKLKKQKLRPAMLYNGKLPYLPLSQFSQWDEQQLRLIRSHSLPQLSRMVTLG